MALRSSGAIEADAPESLDRWVEQMGRVDGDVVLYDGRPLYFSFLSQLPAKARKQKDNVLKLKVRQELGLGEEAVYWAARARPIHSRETIELFTVVVRREAMSDVLAWRNRHGLRNLWVGADICAIQALADRGIIPSESVVLNADGRGTTIYQAGDDGARVVKTRFEQGASPEGRRVQELNLSGSRSRVRLGRGEVAPALSALPGLGALPEAPELDFHADGRDTRRLLALAPEASRLDAVVLGGLADLGARRPVMDSLIPIEGKIDRERLLESLAARIQVRMALPVLALGLVLLGASVASVLATTNRRTEEVAERANSLRAGMMRLTEQDGVLSRIATDKQRRMVPVLTKLHEVSPSGIYLDSLNVNADGKVTMNGWTMNENAYNQYLFALRELEGTLFVKKSVQSRAVTKTEIRREGNDRGRRSFKYAFPIDAQLIGWGKNAR
jgi:hypothetical protein